MGGKKTCREKWTWSKNVGLSCLPPTEGGWLVGYLGGWSESQGSQVMMRKLRPEHKPVSLGSQEQFSDMEES